MKVCSLVIEPVLCKSHEGNGKRKNPICNLLKL